MPKISVIIPTLDESKNLPLLLNDLIEINDIAEIIIIDSVSKDKTKDIAFLYGAKFHKIYKKNRGLQMNFGAKNAEGEWLLFLHADSRLKSNWSEEIRPLINKESIYIYFFKLKINNKKLIFRILESLVSLRCFLFKSPYGDQGILIHKNTYNKNQGYKEIPIMEDFDFIKRIKKKKYLLCLKNSIYTSSRKWENKNIILQSIRNWNLRRRWLKGDLSESIYSEYYKRVD